MRDETRKLFRANRDIIELLKTAREIGWDSINEKSAYRILYLASVLYSFVFPEKTNPFNDYIFSIDVSGPFASLIKNSLIDLRSKEYILDSENSIYLSKEVPLEFLSSTTDKTEWFQIIIYLLGLYGEKQLFRFVMNDPQYRDSFKRESQLGLDTSPENMTIMKLNEFKQAFIETLEDVSKISPKEYLELYFDFVFGQIIRGGEEL